MKNSSLVFLTNFIAATAFAQTHCPAVPLLDTEVARVVGDGSPSSCDDVALRAALKPGYGAVTFNCGPTPVTIALAAALDVPGRAPGSTPTDRERPLIIDGGGLVTLDGQGKHRAFYIDQPGFRNNARMITLQRLAIINTQAPLDGYVEPTPGKPHCAYGYPTSGGGGAIRVRNTKLQLLDVTITNSHACEIGPDCGGGAVQALGSLGVIVRGGSYNGNEAANGGAFAFLQSDYSIADTTVSDNVASGREGNRAGFPECGDVLGHFGQAGAGGRGAAIVVDGKAVDEGNLCRVVMERNTANHSGTIARTQNHGRGKMVLEDLTCRFNVVGQHGGCVRAQEMQLIVSGGVYADNRAGDMGGAISLGVGSAGSTLTMFDVILARNVSPRGSGLQFRGEGDIVDTIFFANELTIGPFPGGPAIHGGGFNLEEVAIIDHKPDPVCLLKLETTGQACAATEMTPEVQAKLIAAGVLEEVSETPPETVSMACLLLTGDVGFQQIIVTNGDAISADDCQ